MTPATDWQERIPEGESEQLERYAEQLRELQRKRAQKAPVARGLHAKAQAGVEAELTVLDNLPEHARIGLFAQPATYRAYVRFSNGAGARQPDRKGDVRGVAIKVLGVAGRKIIPGMEKATTQDFLLIRTAATPFRDADDFVWVVRAAERPALLLPRAIWHFGPLRALRLISRLAKGLSAPMVSVATTHYYSGLPIKFGPYAVRYSLGPHAQPVAGEKPGKGPDYLNQELAARLAAGPLVYDFRVQFFCDEEHTPIEDGSVEWREEHAPFVTVARLTLPQQQLDSPRGQKLASFIESLSFDPWHALEELRPLGNMMRARNHAYRLSTAERHAAPEPDGSESFD